MDEGSVMMPQEAAPPRRLDGLRIVALYKFGKAALLLATTWGVHLLTDPARSQRIVRWSTTLTDGFERNFASRLLSWFDALAPDTVQRFLIVTGGYFVLVMFEGVGLWMRRRWAEWLTVVAGAALIPLEIWRLFAGAGHNHALLLAVLASNVVIVVYLALQLRKPAGPGGH
jgi:uncharacterized membrane protein (DUF2068 family)